MAGVRSDSLYCDSIGNTTSDKLHCCYLDDQGASICQENFSPTAATFSGGCTNGDCITDCQNLTLLYSSLLQNDPFEGNGLAPKRRYLTCANVPNIASYYSNGLLEPNISSSLMPYFSRNTTDGDLRRITTSVTGCLTSTCRAARNRTLCTGVCSPVNLLTNSTNPNLRGLNECFNTLCTGRYSSLPYADADVIGIGVFASYIMQCILVVLLWFGLSAFGFSHGRKSRKVKEYGPRNAQEDRTKNENLLETSPESVHTKVFKDFLVEFHKAQCYFSGTIQIASFAYGIFETDMLVTFMLIPLATNGVLPVVFAFVLLFHAQRSTMDVTILTIACWILASTVYWILYSHVIPVNSEINSKAKKFHAYQQFMYKLSAIDACGGYSALAACPENFFLNKDPIYNASHNIRVLTPIIWTFSTLSLFMVLGLKVILWWKQRQNHQTPNHPEKMQNGAEGRTHIRAHYPTSNKGVSILYWLATLCFLAGIGMQLSLLAIGTSLNMMDRMNWSFGQVVAVTIWLPPLIGYLYDELKELLKVRFHIWNLPK
ncbi:uncharacterized protein BDR25DRAFT_345978 [Lindgomyces ingoldianus]|uniref:Uncharacterized protein n=1 Tax=Lindgomyces ingoldianus TaxID=673940 RepID=A0ACB6QH15_9PLEO|nr:uncharacterized protein BDR25DRAFT_345978 [Lindgomyces ingoldianus]KAF2465397.1 hypothetical protein BDR25DRAFT_345978 [Lindgomyces ingoldianus]